MHIIYCHTFKVQTKAVKDRGVMCVDPGHFDKMSMNLQINYTLICENAIQLHLLNDWGIYFIQMFYDVTVTLLVKPLLPLDCYCTV